MKFIGCALAWRPGEAKDRTSCLVVLDERGGIIANSFASGVEEIMKLVESLASGEGVIVGVNAPLSIPNERGGRRIEKVLSRVTLPTYTASRKLFNGEPLTEEFLAALEGLGIEYTDYPFPRNRDQRSVVEVDSAATLKVLSFERGSTSDKDPFKGFQSVQEPKYRKGNKVQRAAALKEAVDILWNTPGLRLRTGNLSTDLHAPENVDLSKLDITEEMSHADLDRIVDMVEGALAAYTVHRHWKGRNGSMVVGTGAEGYVLLAVPAPLRERVVEECRVAGVPYV